MSERCWQDGLVSIIMPAYNSANFIEASITSVLNQTYGRWELLITDDGSSDRTEEIVRGQNDERIHYWKLSQNSGVAKARNCAIQRARGQYLAFLDSDDIWLPKKLAHQLHFMESGNLGFTYTYYRQFQGNPENCGALVLAKESVDYHELLKGNDIGCLTVMIDRYQIPIVEMPLARHEDYVTWLNLLRHGGRAYSVPEDLARYRKGSSALTSNKWRSMRWTWDVYRESQNLSILQALYYMSYYVLKGLKKHHQSGLE